MSDKVNGNEIILLEKSEIVYDMLTKVGKGDNEHVEPTIENFEIILENDCTITKHIQYNLFSNRPEYIEYDKEGKVDRIRAWKDGDDSKIMAYIEKTYGLFNDKKFAHALSIVMQQHSYNPVKDLIEDGEWDGVERIDYFLKDVLKCDQDEKYLTQVSRMIFYGGISRVYDPGCKFDYMPVLSGEQGIGKSTIIAWLALNNSFYKEVTTIEGKEGIECIEGGWICEFAELMALKKTQHQESMKAFITRQVDKYRRPYGRYMSEIPRTCIFIGTTNEPDYLKDTTGNRRYLPLYMKLQRGEMWARKTEIQNYIAQCWKEALYKYKNGEVYLTIPSEYYNIVEVEREKAMVEDLGLQNVKNYLDSKEVGYRVCSKEILEVVFRKLNKEMSRADTSMIAKYMVKFPEWEKKPATNLGNDYGVQRYWIKVGKDD